MCKAVLRSATGLIRRVAVLPLCCADSPTSQTEISYLKSASGCPRSTAQLVGGPLSCSAAPMRNPHSAIQSLQSEIRHSSTARAPVSARLSGLARFEATPSGVVYKRPHPHRHPAPPRPTHPRILHSEPVSTGFLALAFGLFDFLQPRYHRSAAVMGALILDVLDDPWQIPFAERHNSVPRLPRQ